MEREWERHDLVVLSEEGKKEALSGVTSFDISRYGEKKVREILMTVPGIVRSQSGEDSGRLDIGFSWYEKMDDIRIRVAASVLPEDIVRVITPWDLPLLMGESLCRFPGMRDRFMCLKRYLEENGVAVGVFGSLALETVTGLPYLSENSDIDVIVPWKKEVMSRAFFENCKDLTKGYHLDMEIYFAGRGSVKAGEWFSEAKAVLVKGFRRVELVKREELDS